MLLACSLQPPSFLQGEAATATPSGIRFEVQISTPQGNAPAIIPTIPPTPLPLGVTSTPTVTATTAISEPEEAPAGTPDSVPPAFEPGGTATPSPDPSYPTNTPAAEGTPSGGTPSGNVHTGNITGQIVLVDPGPAYTISSEVDQLEFKWEWTGTELRPCQLVEDHGFEIRMWPALDNPNVSTIQRAEIEPLGAIDAVADQEVITASCDPRNGMRRFTITGLQQTPGVSLAQARGQFFWDVAYVQLEPYYTQLMVSPPRDFFINPSETVLDTTPSPEPSPTPTFQLTPNIPRPEGRISLVTPDGQPTFPANIGPVEFRWRWENATEGAGPCQVGDGYGFELRIGSTQPGFSPLGEFDAKNQGQLSCDPATNIYSYTVLDLKKANGVKATYVGDYRWDGQFFWDVALVSTNPYQAPAPSSTSPPGYFEIDLGYYTGAFDPDGVPLKCADMSAWTEAQAVFLAAGGPAEDPHKFDTDGNEIACDDLRQ